MLRNYRISSVKMAKNYKIVVMIARKNFIFEKYFTVNGTELKLMIAMLLSSSNFNAKFECFFLTFTFLS